MTNNTLSASSIESILHQCQQFGIDTIRLFGHWTGCEVGFTNKTKIQQFPCRDLAEFRTVIDDYLRTPQTILHGGRTYRLVEDAKTSHA